jgi:molybdate-binding protein/DNA-binding XRE family transcriptional regulator
MTSVAPNKLREIREARKLSQVALAAAAQLTRQSIGAIEAGRAMPAVDVALRLAKALDCSVEQLFDTGAQSDVITAEMVGEQLEGRVAMAQIADRWIAYPLLGDGLRTSADALASKHGRNTVSLELMRPSAAVRENMVITGCAAALGLLADRLNSHGGPGRFLWLSRSSTEALGLLSGHKTHVAGVHLVDPKTGDANVHDVRRLVRGMGTALITFARWEVGLVTRVGNPKKVRTAGDLGRRGLRLAIRESGSGVRRLLERELRAVGQPFDPAKSVHVLAHGHVDVAHLVSMGAADAGIATRDVAIVYGLDFIPLTEERYDLVVPVDSLSDARIQRLFDTMCTSGLRRELSALGYDVRAAGDRVADLPAA